LRQSVMMEQGVMMLRHVLSRSRRDAALRSVALRQSVVRRPGTP
jgi:hypothetical protein